MTQIIRNNLLSLLNKNLYHVTIKMRIVDFKNINIKRIEETNNQLNQNGEKYKRRKWT